MRVVAYESKDAPPNSRWIARCMVDRGFIPVFYTSTTEEGARGKAQAAWDAEVAKNQARNKKFPQAPEDSMEQRLAKLHPHPADEVPVAPPVIAATPVAPAVHSPLPVDDLSDLLG